MLEGYRDVGVSVSFIAAPDNWLQSLEQSRLTLLEGEGGMTVRMWVSEGGGKKAYEAVCARCFNTL